ncbi:MAG: PD-(D/E)XK nuclease family protein, partial [Candidatus Azobacteroides sp.]|nr:PD-(D/E)XK nuclease family protein [Candidatus Azobacteroides sp.]
MSDTHSTPFLRLVADDLLKRFGTNLSELTVVFPSRRARLFFNRYLYEAVNHPLWSPQYVSIDELFESVSPYRNADPIQLTGDLYQSYVSIYNARSEQPLKETLDEFFFFGEILLRDFDDIDKNLVNPRLLFDNLRDLDSLKDDFSHLSENQREALSRFRNIFIGESDLKTAFASIWNLLGDVYSELKEKLRSKGIAYPGMLLREVIENESGEFPDKPYVFVGFNILNKCEEHLFKRLKHKSLFYWDYDAYYLRSEAGRFIRNNINTFGSALDDSGFDVFLNHHKEITFLAASTESGQSGAIPSWLDSLRQSTDFNDPDSAIVLCNESVLPAVIHTIPPTGIENVNITMGFPITQTPIAGFIQVLTDLQTKGSGSSGAFHYK